MVEASGAGSWVAKRTLEAHQFGASHMAEESGARSRGATRDKRLAILKLDMIRLNADMVRNRVTHW